MFIDTTKHCANAEQSRSRLQSNVIGRIVVSTGKIATDTNENEKEWVINLISNMIKKG